MGIKKMSDGTTVITRSTSETGHAKNVASFKELIKGITDFGSVYQPSNVRIQLWSLAKKDEELTTVMGAQDMAFRQDANAENDRTAIFAELNSYCTRIVGALSSSGNIAVLTIKDAQSILTKLRGTRSAAGKQKIEAAKASALEEPRTVSVSQQSYDQKIAQFTTLKNLVASQPDYKPNEPDLSITGIVDFENRLKSANEAKIAAKSKLIDARNQRNFHLYDPQEGVVALSKEVKNYVKSIFGYSHANYKKVNGIPFKKASQRAGTL